jgi:prepilin-type N-terminal cleavage/methylation domain-containing protein
MKNYNGFTLVELMIVVAIVGILATVAAPGMRAYISNSSANKLSNTLLIDIMLARNHAITKGEIVKMIPTGAADTGVSTFTPNSTGVNWAQGWTIFEDKNDNNDIDPGELVFRKQGSFGPDAHISSGPTSELLDANKPIGFNDSGIAYGTGTNTGTGILSVATFGCVGDNANVLQINQIGQVIKSDIQCPLAFSEL